MVKDVCLDETDGFRFGHAGSTSGLTGCTVFLFPDGARGGVSVRGGSPGTKGTSLLKPTKSDYDVNAVVLTGGSGYGLGSVSGVMDYLEERGLGLDVGGVVVPIVPAAVIMDLGIGDPDVRPDKGMGFQAVENAGLPRDMGCVGVGLGATVGKLLGMEHAMKGGFGYHVVMRDGLFVGGFTVVNSAGNIIDPEKNSFVAGAQVDGEPADDERLVDMVAKRRLLGGNTTNSVVVTNAGLSRRGLCRVSSVAHDGYARTIRPSHMLPDGDTIFSFSVGSEDVELDLVSILAARCIERSVVKAVDEASSIDGFISAGDL
ncbi:P1 family peptidase [Methanonatronarchaeum sp. AMET6-2]|uniref:P1 family peptidase n=1 Tax=Methanonatronarchaeum sp. AMET6-2 TaxID=2933293 RepID=UPI001FF230FB|nr:P1 family peptidase [Methanonatronarchaeum sp. AMET6-2]UOY10126.1 P1 family peptidase [Methanonatronarchaeum sp. AMET6-2]